MAVILANTTLSARRKEHAFERDSHGVPVARDTWGAPTPAYEGALHEPEDGPHVQVPWKFRADVRLGPLQPSDELTDALGRTFIVRTARHVFVPGYDYVDHIKGTAELTPPAMP